MWWLIPIAALFVGIVIGWKLGKHFIIERWRDPRAIERSRAERHAVWKHVLGA